MSYPYQLYSSVLQSTAIEKCISGHFTSEKHLNLIVAKNSRLEIFLVGPEGLSLMKEVRLYGKIEVMILYRPRKEKKDLIFILTSRLDAMILEANGENEFSIHTRAHGNIANNVGKISGNGIIAAVDPDARAIGLRLYDGLLKFIPLGNENYELKAFDVRIGEAEIQDLTFLYGCSCPTIILLHQDNLGRHIKAHELCMNEKEFNNILWKQDNIEVEASMIIPVPEPLFGALIIGEESILYHNGTFFIAVAPAVIRHGSITCFAKIDVSGRRFILGDMTGQLYMLLLEIHKRIDNTIAVCDIKVELLGEVSIPKCVTYLDNGVVFIGSKIGDSQLVKLNDTFNNETKSFLTIMETYTNIAPIVDMEIVDFEKQGQCQLITCSGGFKDGSLRIIHNGIGIQEIAVVELSGIKGMWSVNTNTSSDFDNILILSFVGHTRVLSLKGEEVEEIELFGIDSDYQTLFCSRMGTNNLLQVIPRYIRLVGLQPSQILSEWMLPSNGIISIVAANTKQIICSSGSNIYYLNVNSNQMNEVNRTILENEVSCIDITPLSDEKYSNFVALGLWNDISIRILKLPSLEEAHREYLGGQIISRSILFATFEETNYLFCALGNGNLFYFIFNCNTGQLMEKKHITLGIQPIVLCPFKTLGTTSIIVCSDRPTVIYTLNRKLIFSNINFKEIKHVCSVNTEAYPGSMAFASAATLTIGKLEPFQKLHIHSLLLHEGPRRIAFQKCSQTFGVVTSRIDVQGPSGLELQRECASSRAQTKSNSQQSSLNFPKQASSAQSVDLGTEVEVHHFLLIGQYTFEILHAHKLLPNEYALSLISCNLGYDVNAYYVVGTGILNPEDNEPKQGRIIMFQVVNSRLTMVYERVVTGGCYSLANFNGKLLACINNVVRLFELSPVKELILECSYFNNIMALFLKTKGEFVLVGDLMRAVTLLQYKAIEGCLEEIARDYNPNWMTAIEILDDDTFLGAENSYNLFVCQKQSSSADDEERQYLHEVGLFHLGDMVNIFRHGSLVMEPLGDTTALTCGSTLFGTISGAIGAVIHISHDLYDLLNELQKRLSATIKSVGEINHSFWRSFTSEVKTSPSEGFIDGELIESFLDLSRSDMENVVRGLRCSLPLCQIGGHDDPGFRHNLNEEIPKLEISVDTVIKIIEDLKRFH